MPVNIETSLITDYKKIKKQIEHVPVLGDRTVSLCDFYFIENSQEDFLETSLWMMFTN